jgi:hypothetical protein
LAIGQEIFGILLLIAVYACVAVIVFSPTLFAGWLYLIARKLPKTGSRLLRTLLTVFTVNLIVAAILFRFFADYVLPISVAEKDKSAMEALKSAESSQERRHSARGAYSAVGPLRGPYTDEFGLVVAKNVIIMVEPVWDSKRERDSFLAVALHVWGSAVAVRERDGTVSLKPGDSPDAEKLRGKLLRSVR